jgi:hypothetical protein
VSLFPWLKAHFGSRALASLKRKDRHALMAAVHILALDEEAIAPTPWALQAAFNTCVSCMRPSTRELAYHAIAHVTDWHLREPIWNLAGLPKIKPRLRQLNFSTTAK